MRTQTDITFSLVLTIFCSHSHQVVETNSQSIILPSEAIPSKKWQFSQVSLKVCPCNWQSFVQSRLGCMLHRRLMVTMVKWPQCDRGTGRERAKSLSAGNASWKKCNETFVIVISHIVLFHSHPFSNAFSGALLSLKFSIWGWQTKLVEPVEERNTGLNWEESTLSYTMKRIV